MIRRLAGVVLVGLVFGIAGLAAPMLEVDSEVYDFGTILEGYAIEHTFVLTNAGDETLIIDRVRATCGCTTTELPTNELAPGQSVELDAVVGTTGFGGSTISKSIYIYSNDPRYAVDSTGTGGKLTLYLRGTVIRSEPYHMSTEDLKLYSILLVDLRDESSFASGHLTGAINIPVSTLSQVVPSLPTDTVLVLYDETGATAQTVVEGLIGNGLPFARVLSGGLAGWTQAYDTQFMVPTPASAAYGSPVATSAGYSLTPTSLHRVLYVLVDLRDADAFSAGHIAGAINIPYDDFSVPGLSDHTGEIPMDIEVIFYDQSGAESEIVVQAMIAAGYANAKSLLGGLNEWSRVYGDDLIWTSE